MPSLEDQFYEIATREVAEKSLVPAIWGKAFSQALGDERKSLALYIKLRVEQLQDEYIVAQSELRKQASRDKELDGGTDSFLSHLRLFLSVFTGVFVLGILVLYLLRYL